MSLKCHVCWAKKVVWQVASYPSLEGASSSAKASLSSPEKRAQGYQTVYSQVDVQESSIPLAGDELNWKILFYCTLRLRLDHIYLDVY